MLSIEERYSGRYLTFNSNTKRKTAVKQCAQSSKEKGSGLQDSSVTGQR